jgi:hypothetical protein
MKDSTIVIVAVVLIAAIAIGAYALTMNNPSTPSNPAAAANDKATKLDIKNNDSNNWAGVEWVFNATPKNDTKNQTWYLLAFVKPNGNLTIDLSNILGYGNQPLPAMTILVNSSSGVFNKTAGGTGNLSYDVQIWSKTQAPGSGVPKIRTNYTNLPIGALPIETNNAVEAASVSAANEQLGLFTPVNAATIAFVKRGGSYYLITTDPAVIAQLNLGAYLVLHQQLLITIDSSGNPTITVLQGPTLCSLF